MKQKIYSWLNEHPKAKLFVHNSLIHPVKTRPRFWLRVLMPFYINVGKKSVIYRSVRKDIAPFNDFKIGNYSVVEDFSVINNLVGGISIGDHTRIGIGNVVIGPVQIGDHVIIAQNVTISGLNHNFEDITQNIDQQGISASIIVIDNDVWIGANSVITKGVKIGKHSVVAAGSIVIEDVPAFSVVGGNPAKVLKVFNSESNIWKRPE